jgi:hypothetical protein
VTDAEFLAGFQSRVPSSRLAGGQEPRSRAELSGTHRLMLAILDDAVALSLHVKRWSEGAVAEHDARGAGVWLKSRNRSSLFAFESICDVLGLDSGYIRHWLRIVNPRPSEAAARRSVRHHGRRPGPVTSARREA